MTTPSESRPAVIVGTGCAGLAAAAELSRNGMDVLMIDEGFGPGGQLLRGSWPARDTASRLDPAKREGFSLMAGLDRSRVRVWPQTRVIGIFPGAAGISLLVARRRETGEEMSTEIRCRSLILATGARERFLPFPGWTLPGVMSLGAAQILIKSHGVLPAGRTLIAGTSPLQMVLASQILIHGGKVAALLDPGKFSRGLYIFRELPHAVPKILEGMIHQARLLAHRVPVSYNTGIVEAQGSSRLESVTAVKLDPNGRPIAGTKTRFYPGALALGHGFVPNVEAAVQAGCCIGFDPAKGGWAVETGDTLETTVPGIFAAGEITGIAGGSKSLIEGRIAALSVLGQPSRHLLSRRREALAYGAFLNRYCRTPRAAWARVPDETLICRCEEITLGDIKRAVQNGFGTAAIVKKATRAGMGHCQGRTCGPMILEILAALTGKTGARIGLPLSRAPIKTVSVRTLSESFLSESALSENFVTREEMI